MKKLIVVLMLVMAGVMASAEATTTVTAVSKSAVSAEKIFTLDELAAFNGENGALAYVAVDGIVYDVTHAKGWKNGKHKGIQAGQDVTKAIEKSPHGKKVLKGLVVVGKLAEKK